MTTSTCLRRASGLEQVPVAAPQGEFSGQVLLVEDNPVNLGVVQKALSKLGLKCETAGDGQEALACFNAAALRPDIHGLPDAGDGWV